MPHARPLSKTYYWIDYKEFCDVVRWRMDTLYKSLDQKLRTVRLSLFCVSLNGLTSS